MRIYKFWKKESGKILFKGDEIPVGAYGGSNESLEEASKDAFAKIAKFKRRLLEGEPKDDSDYEADILEEPLESIDSENIVTRNRYGAKILNSKSTLFIDVDKPPIPGVGLFQMLFGPKKSKFERRMDFFATLATRPECRGMAMRVYSTCKGFRLIVQGRKFSAREEAAKRLLKLAGSDWLYSALCFKQACFRARLTPKPYRIKSPTIKLKYPRTPEEQAGVESWVEKYEAASKGFAVCKLLGVFGEGFQSSEIVKYHDEITGAGTSLPLA
jgi:hypothetical protein